MSQLERGKKTGRKTNKPKPLVTQKEPENVLYSESIKGAQREDQDIDVIIELLESGAEKLKSTEVIFWTARLGLLSIQKESLRINTQWEQDSSELELIQLSHTQRQHVKPLTFL